MFTYRRWQWGLPIAIVIVASLLFTLTDYRDSAAAGQTENAVQMGSVLTPNVCPEGQYLDLTTETCRNLVKDFGFDANQFEDQFSGKEYALGSCSESALNNIFKRMGSDGGKVILPACTLTVHRGLDIPSNVILQGAGIDRTIFQSSSRFSGNMLKAKYRKNVIVRDLSVDGRRANNAGILAWYADNVLVERVNVHHTGKSGIIFRYAKQVTIRYSSSHDQVLWHGIDSKDCFPKDSRPDSQECASNAGDVGPGTLWSHDYAIYSNWLYNNGRFGLDVHANNGEVAGNLIFKNRYGSKFPDASHVWVHRNKFADNDKWGSWVYNTVDAPEKRAGNVVYFENIFEGNKQYPLYIAEPARDIYLLNNQYSSNSPNKLRLVPSSVYACSGSADAGMGVNGARLRTADASKCAINQVAHIFGHDPNAPDPIAVTVPDPTATPTSPPPTPTAAPTDVPPPLTTNVAPTLAPTDVAAAPTAVAPTAEAPQPAPSPPEENDGYIYIPARVEAEDYATGSNGVAYRDLSGGNAGGKLRNEDVDIELTTDEGGGHNVGWIDAGEWLTYDINAKQGGRYDIVLRIASWGDFVRNVHVEIDGVDVTGPVYFDGSAGHRVWTDVVVENVQIDRGPHQLRVMMNEGGFNLNYVDMVARELVAESSESRDGLTHEVPGRVEAEAYKLGRDGVAYSDSTAGNAGNQYRTDDVDIENVTDVDGKFNVGWLEAGEWLTYDIDVAEAGTYEISARVATWRGDERQLHVEIDGQDVTGPMVFDASAGHRVWTNVVKNGVELEAGRHTMKVYMDTGNFNLNYIDILAMQDYQVASFCNYETEAGCLYDGDEASDVTVIERPIELNNLDNYVWLPVVSQ